MGVGANVDERLELRWSARVPGLHSYFFPSMYSTRAFLASLSSLSLIRLRNPSSSLVHPLLGDRSRCRSPRCCLTGRWEMPPLSAFTRASSSRSWRFCCSRSLMTLVRSRRFYFFNLIDSRQWRATVSFACFVEDGRNLSITLAASPVLVISLSTARKYAFAFDVSAAIAPLLTELIVGVIGVNFPSMCFAKMDHFGVCTADRCCHGLLINMLVLWCCVCRTEAY